MIMNKLENLIEKESLAIISCYDATVASMLANTEVDALLVGILVLPLKQKIFQRLNLN